MIPPWLLRAPSPTVEQIASNATIDHECVLCEVMWIDVLLSNGKIIHKTSTRDFYLIDNLKVFHFKGLARHRRVSARTMALITENDEGIHGESCGRNPTNLKYRIR